MADEPETRRVVDQFYRAYLAGDREGMLALMDEEVEVVFLGQGVFRGKAEVRPFLAWSAGLLKDLDFRIRARLFDGERAAVLWEETAVTAGGQPWENHGVDVFHVQGGRLVSVHEYNDTEVLRRLLPPYPGPPGQP